jgi:uncharacterized protein YeaO (DUF488 family)
MQLALQAANDKDRAAFPRRCRAEMTSPEASHTRDVLAALSQHANFSVDCYCEDEPRCLRLILREVLVGEGAKAA